MRGPVLLAALALAGGRVAPAQEVPPAGPDTVVAADTVRRLRPVSAAWRSLLLPGWGQAATGREVVGALLLAWEGTTLFMWRKASDELAYLEEIDSQLTGSKKREVEDWLVLLVFNHLFSAAEAFVAGHLQDFPGELEIRAYPRGVGVRLALPRP